MSVELATCGLSMADFQEGDIPEELRAGIINDFAAMAGTWEDIKSLCDSTDALLAAAGVGFIKRKATAAATLKCEIQHKSVDDKGNPTYYMKTQYPLGITKDTTCAADGSPFDQPDPDTCDWKTVAVWCNGRLIQKRQGKSGTMYDARCVMSSHPMGLTKEEPILMVIWTLIDKKGVKHIAKQWAKKIR